MPKKRKKQVTSDDFEKYIAVTPRVTTKKRNASICEYCSADECEVKFDLDALETLHGIVVHVIKCPFKVEE